MYDWFFVSTGDGARTHTWLPITDFESVASAIPPLLRIIQLLVPGPEFLAIDSQELRTWNLQL